MGILNLTPDSFYSDSRCNESTMIEQRVNQIITEGAKIIDIGGYSSRPGANDITPDEEYSRLATGLDIIKRIAPNAIISVDTFRADVARRCVNNWGVDIINDISGGNLDAEMFDTVASLGVPYILMHMRGTPSTMQQFTQYNDATLDVINDLSQKVSILKEKGVNENYLISICHAGALEAGKEVLNQIRQQFTAVKTELLQLSPTLVTHGGPGSIVIQAIMM